MKILGLINKLTGKPCSKCPYKLGLIQTLRNPCPECRMNGYEAYKQFREHIPVPDAAEGTDGASAK